MRSPDVGSRPSSTQLSRAPAEGEPKIDWGRLDAMTEAERHAAAMADPDVHPMTDAEWARARRVPQVKVIRRAFKRSQEEFAVTSSQTPRHAPICTSSPASRRWSAKRSRHAKSRSLESGAASVGRVSNPPLQRGAITQRAAASLDQLPFSGSRVPLLLPPPARLSARHLCRA